MNMARPLPTRRRFLAMTALSCAAPAILRAAPPLQHLTGPAFGSEWRLTLPDGARADRPAIAALLARIDRQMSPWREDSEITGFNRAPDQADVSEGTVHVARAALRLAHDSGGWFDPSVGPLVHRWGFGPIEGEALGWRGMAAHDGGLSKAQPGQTLDLCGIAKGRALDLVAARLQDMGHDAFLLDIGGELLARGSHPSGRIWQIAIEDPRPGQAGAAAMLRLEGQAAATSGLKVHSYDPGGRRHGHIIDPHRAAPVDGDLASVTVLAADAMMADGWATGLAAAGRAGPDLAERYGIAALFLFDGTDDLRQHVTGGAERWLI